MVSAPLVVANINKIAEGLAALFWIGAYAISLQHSFVVVFLVVPMLFAGTWGRRIS